MSSHVSNEESSPERGVSFVHPMPKSVQSNSVLKLVVVRNVSLHWIPARFGLVFLQNVRRTRLMMNGDKVFVRAGTFDETSPFLCQH